MRVDLISTGDEILYGEIVDTNAPLAASLLADCGFAVGRHHTCGDELSDLTATLKLALGEADAVICCGGLGPTQDDRTLEAVARALGVGLTMDPGLLSDLKEKFKLVGVPFTGNQERQARLPQGARSIPNRKGTAPGVEARSGGCLLFCLPGPPAEYRPMLQEAVLPRLLFEKSRDGATDVTAVRTLRLFGRGEGWVEDALGRMEDQIPGLSVGFRAVNPEIHIKLRAVGSTAAKTEEALDAAEKLAREKLGPFLFAAGDKSFAAAVLEVLKERGMTLAAAESCTGGLLGKLLTDVPGSSSVFKLSAVTYADDMKERLLKVPHRILEKHGAVSAECATAMAEGARSISGADLAVAVTGIAGPDGGTAEKPVGTLYFSVSDKDGTVTKHRLFPARDRDFIRRLSAYTALYLVRRRILGDLK
jgi:nicotinamide-nucleotide amidase